MRVMSGRDGGLSFAWKSSASSHRRQLMQSVLDGSLESPATKMWSPISRICHPSGRAEIRMIYPGEEDGESETSDVEAVNEKIARLKKELAVAEKRAARGEKRKAKEGDKKAKDKKARRDDKRRGRSSCRPRSKDPKKKKARDSGQRKRRSHSFGSARDRKDKRSRKREHSQNLKLMERTRWAFRASGSDRSETETGMTEIQRRPQRWLPYCTDSQFFFCEASAESSATNQLRLTEYSQKCPGRLAARMLLQMHRKSALHSVRAKVGRNRAPAVLSNKPQTASERS